MVHLQSRFLIFAGLLLSFSIPVAAHHGASNYDLTKTLTLTGTVTSFYWANPHCLIHLDAMATDGTIQHWTLEMASIHTMTRRGWNKNLLKPGDKVIADTHPAQNGLPIGISADSGIIMNFTVNGRQVSSK